MNSPKLYNATFTMHGENNVPTSQRSVVILASSFVQAAAVAEDNRRDGELVGVSEIVQPFVNALHQ